jgi:hypothetical protein
MSVRVLLLALAALTGLGAFVCLLIARPVAQLLAPAFANLALALGFWSVLMRRDRRLPVFELSSILMLAGLAYAVLPLIWHAASGQQYSPLSHSRLQLADPTVAEFAAVGWLYFLYLCAFGATYLALRERRERPTQVAVHVEPAMVFSLVLTFGLLQAVLLIFRLLYGVDFSADYGASIYESYAAYSQLPLAVRQIVDLSRSALVVVTCALVVLLFSQWQRPAARWALAGWIAFMAVDYIFNPGGRFVLFSIVLSCALAYDRFIGRLRPQFVAAGLVVMLAGFLAAGILRGEGEMARSVTDVFELGEAMQLFFTLSNEFQISYGSIIELKQLVDENLLEGAPWAVYASELTMLIPSQLLPFAKIDPVVWYTDATQDPDFFTYGVIAQSVLGLGWVEVLLRGVLIGVLAALVHNWWSKRAASFWANVFYVWLAVMAYYTIRNTSLYVLTLILLRFVPVVALVTLLSQVLGGGRVRRGEGGLTERI